MIGITLASLGSCFLYLVGAAVSAFTFFDPSLFLVENWVPEMRFLFGSIAATAISFGLVCDITNFFVKREEEALKKEYEAIRKIREEQAERNRMSRGYGFPRYI